MVLWIGSTSSTGIDLIDLMSRGAQTDKFSLWVNGEKKVTDQAFNANVSSISNIHFTTGGIPVGTMYVDNVVVAAG